MGKSQKQTQDTKTSMPKTASASLGKQTMLISIAIFLGLILTALAIHFFVFKPMLQKSEQAQAESAVNAAVLATESRLLFLGGLAEQLANSGAVSLTPEQTASSNEIVANRRLAVQLAGIVESNMPLARRVVAFPSGQARRDSNDEVPLSFASIELVRQIEGGASARAEAFLASEKWMLQLASPVRMPGQDPQSPPWGTLLVILPIEMLTDVMQPLDGRLELLQEVGAAQQIVHAAGSVQDPAAAGAPLTRKVGNQPWLVRFTPEVHDLDTQVLADPKFWVLVLLPALLLLLIVWAVLKQLSGQLNADVRKTAVYTQARLRGESARQPAVGTPYFDAFLALLQTRNEVDTGVQERKPTKAAAAVDKPGLTAPVGKASAGEGGTVAAEAPQGNEEALFDDRELSAFDLLSSDEDLLGLDTPDGMLVEEIDTVQISKVIFRAYDIRGVVGETLTSEIMTEIGRALGSEGKSRGVNTMCVGYDGRNSSKSLADAVIDGLLAVGMDVIEIGQVPTPLLYYATQRLQTGSGAMITGSHNPASHNGLKMMLSGDTLAGEEIEKLYQRTVTQNFTQGKGRRQSADVVRDYMDEILNDIAVAAPLKVVIDAGNGVSGAIAPRLIEDLGCEVVKLYCDVDGNFPNHHPDPSNPANLADLQARVVESNADIGIAFDGDGDRIGVVTGSGKIIWPDRLLMLFAKDVVSRNPGADVIFDVKCSRRLNALVSRFGGRPVMWKSGHSMIKAKMRETGALLAGEMSGHIFFKERWFGFDDGLYAAVRLLEILGIDERSADMIFEDFPEDISTPELFVDVADSAKFDLMTTLASKAAWSGGSVNTIDGLRVEYADGWGLVRASNTVPALTLRFEAENADAMQRIQGIFRAQLLKAEPGLDLPF
ncbi:MAG: phosphomannomutase [unclassified Hahellaceae]|nr:phosphomannomutase [Hahellaceae bacterium]|tara:strand:+ start:30585 stop:33245 length:2661 start_codon:yes stop_codon:yes gene_type:complete